MKVPYIMESATDCGPRCIRAITGLEWKTILDFWPGTWLSTDSGNLGAPNDTPWDHFAFLEAMNLKYMIVENLEELKQDDIILLHSKKESLPRWWPLSVENTPSFIKRWLKAITGTLAQHWAIYSHKDEQNVYLYMGEKNEVSSITHETFKTLYHVGWPNCAYRIGEGDHRIKKWHRYVAALTGKLV